VSVLNAFQGSELDLLSRCYIGSGLLPGYGQHYWLADDLEAADRDWKILMIHVSPWSCRCLDQDAPRQVINSLSQEYGVNLIVSGHDHYYARGTVAGIERIVLGGGGATLDPDCGQNPCMGCFFHYAAFHVIDSCTLRVDVYKVLDAKEAKEEVVDSFVITRCDSVSKEASFEATSVCTDYRVPIRFVSTTGGLHETPSGLDGPHEWHLGDGTYTNDENPLHAYPKPTDPSGIQLYTVDFTVHTGVHALHSQKEITVYNGGSLTIDAGHFSWNTKYALFLTQPDRDFDEIEDFRGIFGGDDKPFFERIMPGDWRVTIRALGFDEWSGDVTIPPGEAVLLDREIRPHRQDHGFDTIAIGSVPTGANITVSYGGNTYTGTTPYYQILCCDGSNMMDWTKCTFHYEVTSGGTTLHRTGDLNTKFGGGFCTPDTDATGPYNFYVDARPHSGKSKASKASGPLILRHPSDQRIVKKGSARIKISARSKDPLTYRWFLGESGDTSNPIHGGTDAVLVTQPLTHDQEYWVRVYGSHGTYRDSRTVMVTVVPNGPAIKAAWPTTLRPGEPVLIFGGPFDPDEIEENHVYFDEFKAIVTNIYNKRIDVKVPPGVDSRETVMVHVKAGGVWSKAWRLVKDSPFNLPEDVGIGIRIY